MDLPLLRATLAVACVGALAASSMGCESDSEPASVLCCPLDDAAPPADAGISPEALATYRALQVVVEASAAIARDLSGACKGIAQALDAPIAQQRAAEAKADELDAATAWCDLARTAITERRASAGGTLTVLAAAPRCDTPVTVFADCEAQCPGAGACDLAATPPTCSSGKMLLACEGGCAAPPGEELLCRGACTGVCTGTCIAWDGASCAGECSGTCATSGSREGIQPDGTCLGTCVGKCDVRPPSSSCAGYCDGSCDASCVGAQGSPVECIGQCAGDYRLRACVDGTLAGGCAVGLACQRLCSAVAAAKTTCTRPRPKVTFEDVADLPAASSLRWALEARLADVLVAQARLGLLGELELEGASPLKLVQTAPVACVPGIVATLARAARVATVAEQAAAVVAATQ